MEIAIALLIIGILFVSSRAQLPEGNLPMNEEYRDKHSANAINSSALSEIQINWTYSPDEGYEVTCGAIVQNLSYSWTAQDGTLRNNEVAKGNLLTINPVTKENDRIFCCQASNTAENLTKCERLHPLVVTSNALERIIDSSAEMYCKVFGIDGHVDIKWERAEGLPLPDNAIVNDGLLKIPKLARTDTGNYSCVGFLDGKTAFHHEIPLKVVSPLEIVELRITGLNGENGNNVTIQCITQLDRPITYEWKAHTEGLRDLRENEKAEEELLSIYNFKKENEGTFCCVATNTLLTDEKCLTIKRPILEVYHVVILGSSVNLECHQFARDSNMKINWTREDGHRFATNVMKLSNGSLVIKDITREDSGRYTCTAKKRGLSASVTTIIEVAMIPVISITPGIDGNVTAKLGEKMNLTCNTDGHPQPSVLWQKLSSETELYRKGELGIRGSAVYEIELLSGNEAGMYICLAENSVGSRNKTVRVVINQPVLKVYPEESHVVIAGNSITLECRESGGYSNMTFTWSRVDEHPFASNVDQSRNGSLTITDIAIDQEGYYDCSASNGLASASVTTEIEVITLPVIKNPEITNGNVTKKLGDKVELTCEADGHPDPNVQLQKFLNESHLNETILRAAARSVMYEITSLSTSEAGLYLCLAVNSAGSSNKTVRVVINQPVLEVYPKDPHVVIAGNSITLECRETVGYSNMTFTWSRDDKYLNASNVHQSRNGSLTITNIAINQEGRYECSASNGLASASASTEIEVRTLPVIRNPEITNGNVTKKLGDKVELTCEADGHPDPNVQLQKFLNESHLNETILRAAARSVMYEITSLSTSEAGLYLCLAVNSAGSSNKMVRVVINQPVLEVYPKDPHKVIAGNSITLECRETVGYSNMTFTWSRDDKYLNASNVHQSRNGSLTITNIAIDQEGRYECSASNGLASVSASTEIEVRTLPVIRNPEITNGNVTKKLGDKVELTCEADGHPDPNVQLQKFLNESHLNETILRAATRSVMYEITSLSTSEAGLYLCLAVNPAGSSNRTVQVVINQPVLEVYPKDPHVVIAGNSITLECRETVGYSNMTFTWSRDDKYLNASNVHQSRNGSLTITNIAINQEGRYECSASNGLASASASTEIEVRTLPVIKNPGITNGNITKKLGDKVELTCEADGHPDPNVQLQKFLNESHLNETILRAAARSVMYEITSLSTSEAGLYLCLAVNLAGSSNKTVRVVINQPVLEVYPKDPHVVIAGNSITLECRETVGYSNMTFTWSRDDKYLNASNVHQSRNGSLTITDTAINQEGRYECSASNGLASASASTEIEVRTLPVIRNPEITNGNVTKKLGDKVELTCEADGHPDPNVQLQKFLNESHLDETILRAATRSVMYEITSLLTSEAGLYLCLAVNLAGSSNKTVRVVINQPVLEVYPKDPHVVIAGNSITLECRETVGYSNMTFTWSRDDKYLNASNVHQSRNGSLTITDIAINQEGRYECSASNGLASASASTEIGVRTLPVIRNPEFTNGNITKKLGDKVEFTCEADGHPDPNVQLQKFLNESHLNETILRAAARSVMYEITSLSTSEAGLYLCLAVNSAGSSNKTVRVVINQPILEVYPKDPHVVIAGNSITLECRETVGYSNMTFTWSREDKYLNASNVHQSRNGSLTITDIAINQEGRYECSASNGLASASASTEIEVRTLPVIRNPEITNGNVTKKLGDKVELTCEADGHPDPNVQLQKFLNESHLDETILRAATRSVMYEITSLSTSEAGLYLCLAVNPAGSSNKTVRVVINQPVLEVYPKDPHVVIAGNSITLECRETVGYSNMTFTWSRDDKYLNASNVHQSRNGSLTITDIAINQEGRYECSASNGLASASASTEIEVRTLPVIRNPEITNGNVTKKLGDKVELTCEADGHPDPNVQLQKFLNESHLNETILRAAARSVMYEITSLSTSEAGLYLCLAVNSAGSSNKTVRVVINQPILEVYPKDPHVVIAGNSITLECRETVGYSNMTFTWSREDKYLNASNVHQSRNGSLTITDIAINQEGRYECSASNGLASASASTEIEVRTLPVIRNPEITNGNVTKKLGDKVELTCEADGHPDPNVQLQKFLNESHLDETILRAATRSVMYEITSLSTSEAGLYLCLAVNPAGSSNKTVRVVINQPVLEVYPKDPHVVIAGNSITLECRETVGYSNMTFTWSRDDKYLNASNVHQSRNGSLTITDIAINQEGRYECSASNGLASASASTEIEVRTLPVIRNPEITNGNVTKKLGDKVELTCEADGHPDPNVHLQKFLNESHLNETILRAATRSVMYEITSLSTSEAGLYLCLAVNPAGSSNKTVRVVINQPVLEVYPKDPHVVIAGNSITLECRETVGYSNMTFTWSRDDKYLNASNVHQSRNGSLTITNIAINQEGRYECSASNGLASASTEIEVRTLPVIRNPEITNGNVTKKLGDKVELTCEADGHPDPNVQLQKFLNESHLDETILRAATRSVMYEITSLSTSEAGLYLCLAVNLAGSSNKTVRVVITQPVLEVYPKDPHVVIAGNSITLECRETVGYSNMTFTWSRDDKYLNASNVHQSRNGSLTITDIAINQEGRYECSASNGLASASASTEIDVRTLPVIRNPEITNGNVTKKLGDKVKLTCEADGHPDPNVQLQKFLNESHLDETILRAATRSVMYEITSLSTSEAGLYLCLAVNLAGSSNKTVRVVITQPVLEVYPKDPHVVIAGNSITLECRETVGYSNMTFTWSRDDKYLNASNVHQSRNGSLTITDIAINQEGRYECSASNGLASASASTEIEVRTLPVIRNPEITNGNVTKKLGDKVELTCEADGHPDPNVQLQKFLNESHLDETILRAATRSVMYEITSLSTSEAGLYLCLAVNPAGSSNKTVRVVINQPVLEVYPKDPHVVIAGNSITLECRETVGYSNMTFTWSRDDKYLNASNVHQSRNGSLTITDIAINQEGRYECSASNGLASASASTEIEVRTLPVIRNPEITNRNVTKKLGDKVELTCEADGHPDPNVQLQKFLNESHLDETILRAATRSVMYEITSLSTSEARLYLCLAVNTAGSSNKTVRVVINQPVLEVYPKDPHVVIAGNSITLECRETVGYSNMTFTWSRDDKYLNASNVHQSRNGSLTITDIAINQEGRYECSASNGLASASASTEIEVRTLPVIRNPEITNGNVTKKLGDKVKLTCEADGHPDPNVQLQKFLNESHLDETILRAATRSVMYEITSLSTSEAGLYLCLAVNLAGSSNKTVRVVITQPVLEVYPKDPHVVIAGNSITLECRETVGYSNMTFTWSRDDKYLNASNVHQSRNGSLTITDIAINQEGRYECSASNGLASASASTEIEVRTLPVIRNPEITNGNVTKKLGDKVELTCEADGHPDPNVQLQKFLNESHLDETILRAATRSVMYEITSLSTSEAGLYLCLAVNPAGSSNKTVRVVINQPVLEVYPKDPHVVIAGNSITLECRETVGYSNMTFTWSRDDKYLNASNVHQSRNGSLTITDIAINQEGRYECSASNGLASASASTEIEVRTLPVIRNPEITNRNVTKKLGDKVELTCEADGHPDPNVQLQKFLNESHLDETILRAATRSVMYEITSLSTSEARLYLCLAVNTAGSSNKTVRVVINQPVLEVYPKDPHVVIAGNSITLECRETVGYSNMTFTWSRDDKYLNASNVHQSRNGSLTITDIAINQEGRYECSASNGLASASASTEIDVRTLPVIRNPEITNGNVTKKLGDKVKLTCEADGHPDPNVQLQKFLNESHLDETILRAATRSVMYEITSLSTSEAGLYLCLAVNLAGSSNKTVRVVITQPVLEVYPKDPHVVIAGNSITLECRETVGYSNMTFTWSRDDKYLNASNVHQSRNGSLTITDIAINQEGRYECSASNGLASASASTEIEVRTLPVIRNPEITNGNVTKKLGDKVELTCEADGHPDPNVQLQKFLNESHLDETILRAATRSVMYEITSLSTSEAGLYLCLAVNPAGSSNKTVRVVINQPVLEVYPKDPHVVIAGNSITLECRETVGYSNMTFTWSRDDKYLNASNVHQSRNGSLTITNIAINQEGRYECSASNGLASASASTEIEVRTLPVIKNPGITNGNITKKLGDKVELTCEADGHPGPNVQLQKFLNESHLDETILRAATRSVMSEITSLSTSDAGLYLCLAVNPAGSSNKTVRVVINQPVLEVYPKDPHVVIAGNPITLECRESVGYSNMTFAWSRVDEHPFASNVDQSRNGSLTITDIAIDQEGHYECSASNGLASASVTTEIEVRTLPVIKIPEFTNGNITKKLGDEIELTCEAEGHPTPNVKLQKFSNESHLAETVLRAATKMAVHKIASLSTSEAGLYLCSAVNPAGSSNKTVRVVINQPVLEVNPKESHVVIAGKSITLECRESVGYSNMTFTWSRVDEHSFASNVDQSRNGSLTITDIAIDQEGHYECSASNGVASASFITEIEVRTLPVIKIPEITDGNITKKLGDEIELTCEAEGHPTPNVQWLKFSFDSHSTLIVKPTVLESAVYKTILSTNDVGLYVCLATNSAGFSYKTARIVMETEADLRPDGSHVVFPVFLLVRGVGTVLAAGGAAGAAGGAAGAAGGVVEVAAGGAAGAVGGAAGAAGGAAGAAGGAAGAAGGVVGVAAGGALGVVAGAAGGAAGVAAGGAVGVATGAAGGAVGLAAGAAWGAIGFIAGALSSLFKGAGATDGTGADGRSRSSSRDEAESYEDTSEEEDNQLALEVYPKGRHVVIAGNSITLECQASSGYSDLKFTWTREDNSPSVLNICQSVKCSLTIMDIAINQEGRYKCSASNRQVSASVTTEIEVRTLPDIRIPEITDGNITSKLGDEVKLTCEAEGHPKPEVQWQKFSNESHSYETVLRSNTESVAYEIKSLSNSKAGLYLCLAENPAGSTNKTVQVVIKQPVLEVYPEEPHVVIAGNAITLECRETAGYPNMTFTWSREDECSFASNVHQFDNGSLTITDISFYQEGRFNCSASNGLASASITTEIEVRTLPDINIQGMTDGNIIKKLGDEVKLTCGAEGHPKPKVQWQKFSNESQSYQTVLRSITESVAYEIKSLSNSEAGLYLCLAENPAGSTNKTVQVVIKQPVLEVYPEEPHVVIAGNAITLECRETAGYPNMTFTWSREDECSFSSNVHQFDNGSLTITDISFYQEGRFNCSASNGLASASITTEIEVRTLPDINIQGMTDGNIIKKLGDEVKLTCGAEGHPKPKVQWQKFSNESQSYQTVLRSITESVAYEIKSLSNSEAGLYLCLAENPAGSTNKTVQVVIKQPVLEVYPEDPHVVIAGNAITLECRETAGYSNMTFTWSREDECSFASNVDQFDNGSLTITDISFYQEGRFNCSASNGLASASITTEIEVRTLPDINIQDMTDGNIIKKLGDEVKLTCGSEGHPKPKVQWQKFSNESHSYQTVLRSNTESVAYEIKSLSNSEAGLYLCLAENPAGTTNKTVQVVIKQPVLEVYPEDPHVVIAGNAITLECRETAGYPNMTFTWSREDECSFASNVHQFDNGSLTITDISLYQEGRFNCSASNGLASASITTEIEVRTLPDINIQDMTDGNIIKKLGDVVKLTCGAEGHPKPKVQWQKFSNESHSYGTVLRSNTESVAYEIKSLSNSEAGLYLCLAENPAGSTNKTVEVVIKQPVLEVYPEDPHVVIAGNAITLECRETAGYPNMTFTWSREDECSFASNFHQFDNGSLTITDISLYQEGRFNCSASNGLASASITTEIEVRTLPDINIQDMTDGNIIKKLGDEVKLTCGAEGHPKPKVQWQKFSNESHSYQTVLRSNTESVAYEIKSLSDSEAGLYLCSAENPAGSTNKTVQVVIKQPVLEVYPEDPHVVIAGNAITLECRETAGYPNMTFTWSREDECSFASNFHQFDNGSLTITDISLYQEGRFNCSASNGLASASITTEIEVRTLPDINIQDMTDGNIIKKLGDEVKLTCGSEGHPKPKVQWQKFSNESHSYQTVLRSNTESVAYEIKSLSNSEAGLYLCLAENPAGTTNKTVQVVIKQPVLEVYPEDPHVVIAGNAITLECRETAGYPNMTFTWSREDKCSFASNVHQFDNGSLTITDISLYQEGRFNCSASNGLASASITTEIEVRTLPDINIQDMTDGNIIKKLGDVVKLTCGAEGHPKPKVQWQKFSNESHSYGTVLRSNTESVAYEIKSLSNSEAGLYLCLAENPAGSTNKTVQVVIKQPVLEVYPEGPHVVIAGNAITLECRETAGYSNMIFTWSREDECSFASNFHQFDNGSLTITDISLYQEGRFNCSASNGLASASITTEIEVRTLPDINIQDMTDGNIIKKLGDEVKLTCGAEGHPKPKVQWQKFSNESHSYQTVLRSNTESVAYEIKSLSNSEAGLYLCLAENPAGSTNKTVQVVIKQPVLEVYPEGPHVVIAGNAITLECRETAGYSNMTFTWSREDKCSFASNIHQFDNGSLTITDVSLDQEGRFHCSASNGIASASITTEIEVRTLPDISIRDMTDGNITKKLGDEIELTCEAEGHPAPDVQLQKFSNDSDSNGTVLRVATKSAVHGITSLSTSEAGLYLCLAVNPAGSSNKTFRVVIQQPVLEVYPKDPHVVIAGNSITLECRETAGYSNMTYTWSRKDECSFASNVHQSYNGSLIITNIAIHQAGNFICSASNAFTSTSVTTEIEVRTLPDIIIPEITNGNITKKLGDEVELICEAEGHPEPDVQWQKFSSESHSYQTVLQATTESAVHKITSLSTSEAGLYLCLAVNPAGSSNKTFRVVIQQPVLEVYPKESHVVIAGNSITLKCRETAGYSNMTYTWSRKDECSFASNVHQSYNGSLIITNIAIHQAGYFICSASNAFTSTSVTTEIEVRTLPDIIIPEITNGNITKKLGDEVELICEAEGHPEPDVQWQKFSSESHSYQTVLQATTESAVYEITSFSTSDAGLYLCSAVNPAGSSNKTFRVVIQQPVLELYPKDPHVVIAGNSITLECRETAGYSNMTYTWSREDECSFAPNVHPSDNGSLTIRNIAIYQAGHFVCSASNALTSASVRTEIEVRTLPVIIIPEITNENLTKKLGDRVGLICEAEGHPEPDVQWQKFSSESHSYQTVLQATTEWAVYEIPSLSTSDAGLYLCLAVNPAGSSNKTVQIVIKQPALEVYPRDLHVVIAGNSITLECRETAGYSDMKFTWSREGKSLSSSNIRQSDTGSLTITKMTINQEGRYKCSASNGLASASITTKIEVITLPVIKIPENSAGTITQKLGDKFELTCKAEGHPVPDVKWQKFSTYSHSYQTVEEAATQLAVHTITSLSTSEAGLYLCFAVNRAGSSSKTVRVVIKQPALEVYPRDPHVVKAGSSITLKCRESAGYSNMIFIWSHEGTRLLAPNVHQSDNGVLTIADIEINQAGRYKCFASNGKASASTTADIAVDPSISEVKITHIIELPWHKMFCLGTGGKLSTQFTADPPLKPYLEGHFSSSQINFIYNMRIPKGRTYCCEVHNSVRSRKKCLQVGKLAMFTLNPSGLVGESIELECIPLRAKSMEDVHYKWERTDGYPLPRHAIVGNYNLKFPKLAKTDAATYTCVKYSQSSRRILHAQIPLTVNTI